MGGSTTEDTEITEADRFDLYYIAEMVAAFTQHIGPWSDSPREEARPGSSPNDFEHEHDAALH